MSNPISKLVGVVHHSEDDCIVFRGRESVCEAELLCSNPFTKLVCVAHYSEDDCVVFRGPTLIIIR